MKRAKRGEREIEKECNTKKEKEPELIIYPVTYYQA
jgi:hypothetical protein